MHNMYWLNSKLCVWMCFFHIYVNCFSFMSCVCVCACFSLYTVFFSPSFIHAISVHCNCVCMSLHVLLFVVCMPCSVMAFEWLSHVLWCHAYYCTGSVWFSRNFVLFGEFSYSLIYTLQYTFDERFAPSPSEWQHCSSSCSLQWPQGPSARAVWDLWGRLPAQGEGEDHADCKWQWMVEWIVHVWLQCRMWPLSFHKLLHNTSWFTFHCSSVHIISVSALHML